MGGGLGENKATRDDSVGRYCACTIRISAIVIVVVVVVESIVIVGYMIVSIVVIACGYHCFFSPGYYSNSLR